MPSTDTARRARSRDLVPGHASSSRRPQAASAAPSWRARVADAAAYGRSLEGVVCFVVTDEIGRLRGWCPRKVAPSASVLKTMLLVAYLHRIPGRVPPDSDRALLRTMIRRSDNAAASSAVGIVGRAGVNSVAARLLGGL